MRRSLIAVGAIVVASLISASKAHAQYWLTNHGLSEERGLRTGSFEFHPSVGAEFGYDSNVYARPSNDPMGVGVVPVFRLRVTPSISVSTINARRTGVASGGEESATFPTANFRAYVALIGHLFRPASSTPSSAAISSLDNVGGSAGFRLELFPGRTFQVHLFDDAARIVQGGSEFFPTLFIYNGIRNSAGINLIYAPNGGIFDLRLSYTNSVMNFEDQSIKSYNNIIHEISLHNRWRFLPKTSLLWEASISPTVYYDVNQIGTGLFNSYPIKTRFGLNGLLLERVGLLLMVGYGSTNFYNSTGPAGDNMGTVLAQAEIKYFFTPVQYFQFGLMRDLLPSFLGNYYVNNVAYINYTQGFGNRFRLAAEVSGGIYQFGFATNRMGIFDPSRIMGPVVDARGRYDAVRLTGTLFGEYRPLDWFGLNATAALYTNITDANLDTGMARVPLAWFKFETFIGARVSF